MPPRVDDACWVLAVLALFSLPWFGRPGITGAFAALALFAARGLLWAWWSRRR